MDLSQPPRALLDGHADIRDGLARAAHETGGIGESAQRAVRSFSEHAEKEERIVFPLLGLLPRVTHNRIDADMAQVLPQFDQLEAMLPDLLAEHRMISHALEKLVESAKSADRADFGGLVARILDHQKLEEAVIYPSALLLGRYLSIRLGRTP